MQCYRTINYQASVPSQSPRQERRSPPPRQSTSRPGPGGHGVHTVMYTVKDHVAKFVGCFAPQSKDIAPSCVQSGLGI